MAILKYTKADGTVVKLNSYKVNNLIPQQSKGDNPNAVMSQKAVTDELNAVGLQIDEVTGQITTINTTLGNKANATDLSDEVNRATTAEGTLTTSISDEVTRATTAEGELSDRVDVLENVRTISCGTY